MKSRRLLAIGLLLLAASPAGAGPARFVQEGLVVELETPGSLAAGQASRFRLRIRDEGAGAPLAGLDPAAWLAPRDPGEPALPELCRRKLRTYLGGSLFSRAALDLNGFQVLALADPPRLQAFEPDFGFGRPRPLADLALPSAAFDWVLDVDHRYVFLSLPESGGVARVDTQSWTLEILSGAGQQGGWRRPERLGLQPDGHYLWVAVAGGVMAFTTEPFAPAGFLATHPALASPPAALEFSADGRLLFVAHRDSPRLAAIATAEREPRATLELPGRPAGMAFSALARRLYVTLAGDATAGRATAGRATAGSIVVADESPALVARLAAPPFPGEIRFTRDGRHGIVLHPEVERVSIFDAARGRVVQSAAIEGTPDQLAFSGELAYLRLRERTELLMLPLAALGREGERIPTFDTVGGDHGFLDGFAPIAAAGLAQPPGVDGMLIANPGDRAIYFYKEGLAAPMGQLLLGDTAPRAVLALDRSLRELEEKGAYETTLPLPAAGDYDLVFFLPSPRLVHCFPLRIAPAPASLEETP